MRDLWLCTLLRYDKLCMKRKIWENGGEAGSSQQNSLPRLSSPSDHSSVRFLLLFPFHILHTHPHWSHQLSCKAFVKTCDFNSAAFWMLISCSNLFQICIFITSTFPQAAFCSFHCTSYVFFSSPPPQPPNFLLSAQSWPGLPVLFLACLSVYLSVCGGAGNSETSPQHTALISSRQTWAKKVQPDSTAEKVISPPVRHVTHIVSMRWPQWYTHSSVRLDCRDMWRFMGRGWENVSKREEVTEWETDRALTPKKKIGKRKNGTTCVQLVEWLSVL